MKEREEIIVGTLVALLLLLWFGFDFHRSPRFAGSLWGGVLAVAGSSLMLVPALYIGIKRIRWVRARVTRRISMRTILALHIYAGVLGPILVILHTGHKFESPLGIALTSMTLIVVVSGFIGRYLISKINRAVKGTDASIRILRAEYERMGEAVRAAGGDEATGLPSVGAALGRVLFQRAGPAGLAAPTVSDALAIIDPLADLEYTRNMEDVLRRVFQSWLKLHIVLSCALYVLLGLHVWEAIYFGLRWFR
jgi:hypothetical protein